MMTHEQFESIAALEAIGVATPEESSAFLAHAAACADCRRARDEYEEAASLLARDLDPVTPPADVRDRIFAAIDESSGNENVIDAEERLGISRWWMAAAALFLALWGWRELSIRVAREKVNTSEAEIRNLAGENQLLSARNEKLSAEMAALASRDTRTIALTGQQVSPSASAKVFLEPQQRRAVVFFYNLPANPPRQELPALDPSRRSAEAAKRRSLRRHADGRRLDLDREPSAGDRDQRPGRDARAQGRRRAADEHELLRGRQARR